MVQNDLCGICEDLLGDYCREETVYKTRLAFEIVPSKHLIDEIHGRKEEESETLPTAVFELLGEPAIVIKGIPPLPPNNNALVPCDIIGDANSNRTTGFGEWLKGREVRKLFGEQFYTGKVTKFDKEAGWYKVVYDDGDFEDLEWHELQEVLLPRSGCYYPVESISSEDH